MKPTVISANSGNADPNAINVPINHAEAAANTGSYGSPRQQPQHQIPAHFQQDFGFEPDMDIDMDMFPRGRLGRMHHDPFANFGGSHFGFPQWTNSMGRRRMPADTLDEDNAFFDRLPNEFRQYMPGYARNRDGRGFQQPMTSQHPYQTAAGTPPNTYANMPPQSPSKKLCDAAIQTEDTTTGGPGSQDQVDHATRQAAENLNQHGLRNTVDMGIKTPSEGEQHGPRAHSAPPPEQMQQNNGGQPQRHMTPPQQTQFGTQTSPQSSTSNAYQKVYYPPHQQPHPMQKQRTPPPSAGTAQGQQPQTPGGTYVRTIPIFVEGRSEPIINAHKEIPNQNAPPHSQQHQQQTKPNAATGGGGGYTSHPQQQYYAPGPQNHQQPQTQPPPQQQQHRPTPLNTQQQPTTAEQQNAGGPPPQTPHTLDSINKIQDIQRDVLALMGKVEKFAGTRKDKEYVYLDEMLTRNLLKLDTIDTQGKDSIRLARKEAIKCIQASINVLEAKAEENAKTAQAAVEGASNVDTATVTSDATTEANVEKTNEQTNETTDESKPQEPIPLPPPVDEKSATNPESNEIAVNANIAKEGSPKAEAETK